MKPTVEDRVQIAELMTGWIYRDLGEWDNLRNLFWPDASLEVTWFKGKASDFVDQSIKMGASDAKSKHVITSPLIEFLGDKAVSETTAIIVADSSKLGIGCECHCRFYDRLERRNGEWKIVDRRALYDMATFTSPTGSIEIEQVVVNSFPREYAPLAYLLEKSGFPITSVFPTKGSQLEKQVKQEAHQWLNS